MSEAMGGAEARSGNVGRFFWYELMTSDVVGAKAFYTQVIGWETEAFAGSTDYTIWKAGGAGVGGLMATQGGPPGWLGYVQVEDVDRTVARAQQLGGSVYLAAQDIPDIGRFAVLGDPQGAGFAVMNPIGEERPPEMRARGHIGWHELNSTDAAAAWTFYSALFGWLAATSMDMGEYGTYSIFRHPNDANDSWLGGMSDMATHTGAPAHWLFYFNVDDMDATLARIAAAGGKVLSGPMDVPGGGKSAIGADPQGVPFAVFAEH
jgi:hypothetical protein